jgi:hypothetical protein
MVRGIIKALLGLLGLLTRVRAHTRLGGAVRVARHWRGVA